MRWGLVALIGLPPRPTQVVEFRWRKSAEATVNGTAGRVWLTDDEYAGYYYGFANDALWPLCHRAFVKPVFRPGDLDAYRAANARFADAVFEEAIGDSPVVLVQDYHFALAPAMLRERMPLGTIITFWHIPWPEAQRFRLALGIAAARGSARARSSVSNRR